MPCNDTLYLDKVGEERDKRHQEITSYLCALLVLLEHKQVLTYEDIPLNIHTWWTSHKEEDQGKR